MNNGNPNAIDFAELFAQFKPQQPLQPFGQMQPPIPQAAPIPDMGIQYPTPMAMPAMAQPASPEIGALPAPSGAGGPLPTSGSSVLEQELAALAMGSPAEFLQDGAGAGAQAARADVLNQIASPESMARLGMTMPQETITGLPAVGSAAPAPAPAMPAGVPSLTGAPPEINFDELLRKLNAAGVK